MKILLEVLRGKQLEWLGGKFCILPTWVQIPSENCLVVSLPKGQTCPPNQVGHLFPRLRFKFLVRHGLQLLHLAKVQWQAARFELGFCLGNPDQLPIPLDLKKGTFSWKQFFLDCRFYVKGIPTTKYNWWCDIIQQKHRSICCNSKVGTIFIY